jgi:hypothetical protein
MYGMRRSGGRRSVEGARGTDVPRGWWARTSGSLIDTLRAAGGDTTGVEVKSAPAASASFTMSRPVAVKPDGWPGPTVLVLVPIASGMELGSR